MQFRVAKLHGMSPYPAVFSCPFCAVTREVTVHQPPQNGDFSLCGGCLQVGVFDEVDGEFVVRFPTLAEHGEVQMLVATRLADQIRAQTRLCG